MRVGMHARCWVRGIVAAAAAGAIPLLAAAPAGAELSGPCEATGTIGGQTYDPKQVNRVELPLEGDVAWTGSIAGEGERTIKGHVKAKLPGGIGEVTIGSWDKQSSTYSNADVYSYDFPSVLEGIEVPVSGSHEEPGQPPCKGSVTVVLGDGGFGNPASIPALVLTALSATTLVVAVRGGA